MYYFLNQGFILVKHFFLINKCVKASNSQQNWILAALRQRKTMDIHPCQKLQTLLYSTLTLQIYDSIKYQNMIYQLTALVLQAKIA